MNLKTILNYSPNFDTTKRTPKQIKFIIFHYTGMKKESEAINRLTNIQSKVSCHYLVKKNGEILIKRITLPLQNRSMIRFYSGINYRNRTRKMFIFILRM